jgi:site-specific recombinase XerD
LRDEIEEFKRFLKNIKNLSDNSIKSYESDLKSFESFVGKKVKDITYKDVEDYIYDQRLKGLSTNTIIRRTASLKVFFRFLLQRKYVNSDPMIMLHKIKKTQPLPKFLTEREIEKLFSVIDTSTKRGFRDYTMLYLMLMTGLRVSELLNLRIQDVDLYSSTITVRMGKGRKDRVIPLNDATRSVLHRYLSEFKPEKGLFDNKNSPKSRRGVLYVIRKYCKLANIEKRVTPHTFRHTFATLLLRKGESVRLVQSLLGHSSISTTAIYLHIIDEEKKKAVDSLNDVVNLKELKESNE